MEIAPRKSIAEMDYFERVALKRQCDKAMSDTIKWWKKNRVLSPIAARSERDTRIAIAMERIRLQQEELNKKQAEKEKTDG